MKWGGPVSLSQDNVFSVEDCQNICGHAMIQNFVWFRTDFRCQCKDTVGPGELAATCCMSGHSFGATCEGELRNKIYRNFLLCCITEIQGSARRWSPGCVSSVGKPMQMW